MGTPEYLAEKEGKISMLCLERLLRSHTLGIDHAAAKGSYITGG